MKRILFVLAVLLAVVSIGCVSAADNATDVIADDSADVLSQDADDEGLSQTQDEVGNALEAESDSSVLQDEEKASSEITSSNVKGYESFKSEVSFKLTSNDVPLANRSVSIMINDATYDRVTDSEGIAKLTLSLKAGTYIATCTYDGDNTTQGATGTSKVVIKEPTKTKLKVGDKYIVYRQGSKCLFYVKLVDSKGKAIKDQWVIFKIGSKTYKAKTTRYGNAKIFLKLKKGKYKVKYYFKKNAPYLASKGAYKIRVGAKMPKGNGYWLWPAHMKSISLSSLSKKGTKHLFLHVEALSSYGKSYVVSFIKSAHRHGIKVHLWMQVAYSGGDWVSLVDDHGRLKYGFLNKKVAEAKYYAQIKGVDGVHFDYMRYGGTAHKHPNAIKSVNYFVKKASAKIHKVRPNCMVSVALMPEPKMMHYYYGQDVPTLSKYCDCLLPMAYKGSYGQPTSWIKSVTKTFVKQSNGAQIWTGLQTYHSENNPSSLPESTVLKDAKAAMKGGACGVVLFRIGISCNFNFKRV